MPADYLPLFFILAQPRNLQPAHSTAPVEEFFGSSRLPLDLDSEVVP